VRGVDAQLEPVAEAVVVGVVVEGVGGRRQDFEAVERAVVVGVPEPDISFCRSMVHPQFPRRSCFHQLK
jgi:hypothetical protein